MVGLSGGKDSMILLEALADRRRHFPFDFGIHAIHVSAANIGYKLDTAYLDDFCKQLDIPLHLEEIESASSVMNELCRFLNIDAFDFTHVLNERYNTAPENDMSDSIRAELSEFYRPHQEKLEHLINRKLPW